MLKRQTLQPDLSNRKGEDQAKKVKTICLHADETVLDRLSPEQAEMVTNTLELLISAYEEDSDE